MRKSVSILSLVSFLLLNQAVSAESSGSLNQKIGQTTIESAVSSASVDACNTAISRRRNADQKNKKLINEEKSSFPNFRAALMNIDYDKMPFLALCTVLVFDITQDCLFQKVLFFDKNESPYTELEKEVTENKGKLCYQVGIMNADSYADKILKYAISKSVNLDAAKKWNKEEYLKIKSALKKN